MKYCQNCGSQHDDNVGFCSHCGGRFENNQPPVYNQVEPNYYQGQTTQNGYYAQPNQPRPILSQNPVLNKVKELATTPLFLISIIIYSVMVFTRLVNIVAARSLMTRMFESNYYMRSYNFGRLDLFGPLMGTLQRVISAYALLALVPCILICVGFWMFYSSSTTFENRSTSGLTLIKISVIINFVAILVIPICIIFITILAATNSGANVRAGMFLLLFLIAIAFVLPIMYFLSILKTIDQIRATIVTGVPTDKTSVFLVVMNYIVAGISIIMLFFTKSYGVSALISLLNSAFLIMISIGLYEYKKEMTKLIYQPQYGNNVGNRSGI